MANNRLVNLRNFGPVDPKDGSLSHEWPLPVIWTPIEMAKDLEHHCTTVIEHMRYGCNLRGAPTSGFQCPTSNYQHGACRVNMLQGDLFDYTYDSDSDDDVEDNHLQGFTSLVLNNVQRNDYHTPRNLDPAAVQSRRERSPPFEKACHACG